MCKAIDDYTEKGHVRHTIFVWNIILIYQLLVSINTHTYNYKT